MMYDFNGKKDLIIFIIASRKIKECVKKFYDIKIKVY